MSTLKTALRMTVVRVTCNDKQHHSMFDDRLQFFSTPFWSEKLPNKSSPTYIVLFRSKEIELRDCYFLFQATLIFKPCQKITETFVNKLALKSKLAMALKSGLQEELGPRRP